MNAPEDDAQRRARRKSSNAGFEDFEDSRDSSPSRLSHAVGLGIRCQVPGCKRNLDSTYAKKCRCCTEHRSAVQVLLNGIPHRFCQKCSRFQEVSLFDGTKRNCRQRLFEHNCRQRRLRMLRRAKVDPDVEAKLEEDAMELAAFGVAALAEQGGWAPAVPPTVVARPAVPGGFGHGTHQPSSSTSTVASDGAGVGNGVAGLDPTAGAALAEVATLLSGLEPEVLTNPQVLGALQQLLAALPGAGMAPPPAPVPAVPAPPSWGAYAQPDPTSALAMLLQQMAPQPVPPPAAHNSLDQALMALLGAAAAGTVPPAGGPGPFFGGQPPK